MRILPDLHRAGQVPDWEMIDPSEWNEHQRRAAETNGWDTPGNRESLKGFLETLAGLALISTKKRVPTLIGLGLVLHGRRRDLRDGKIADATGTKSATGEAVDAGFDTALRLASALTLRHLDILPKDAADEMIANTGVKMVAAVTGKALGHEMHTGRIGKYSTYLAWVDMPTLVAKTAADQFGADGVSQALERPTEVMTEVVKRMDRQAASDYVHEALVGEPARPGSVI